MAHMNIGFGFRGNNSRWSVQEDFNTLSYTITAQIKISQQLLMSGQSNDIKENLYNDIVFGLAKALGELREHLLGPQNP